MLQVDGMSQPETQAARSRHEIVVSIINYRTGAMTIDAVRSVLADRSVDDVHVVVVDNRSDDGSAEMIAEWIAAQDPPPPVTLIRSETNSGFSSGHNQGMAACSAEAYLVLNSDALLRPGALGRMLATLRESPQAGFIAPRLEHDDGEPQLSCFRFPNPIGEMLRMARLGPLTRLFRKHDQSLGFSPDPEEIGWASFACILVRGAMRDAIGPMDEGFFLYSEDTEYCWRARRAGWRVVHEPRARAVHLRGASGPAKSLRAARKRLPRYIYASRTRFFYLAYGRSGLLAANLLWYPGAAIGWARRRLAGHEGRLVADEEFDIWTNFLDPLGDDGRKGS